jgi:soluble lytic murein transglycosylase-like protein
MLRLLSATAVIAALFLSGCATKNVDTAGLSQSSSKKVRSGSTKVAYAGNVRIRKIAKAVPERKEVLIPTDPSRQLNPDEKAVLFPTDPSQAVQSGEKAVLFPSAPETRTSGKVRKVVYRTVVRDPSTGERRIVRTTQIVKGARIIRTAAASVPQKRFQQTTTTRKSARILKKKRIVAFSVRERAPRASGAHQAAVTRFARAYGVPVSLAHAVVRVESGYRANARGGAGEIGMMQVKLSTARMMGYRGSARGLYNPETNLKYGMKYLAKAHRLGGGSVCGTILKYNAGHGARRMNPISARYCSKVKRIISSRA